MVTERDLRRAGRAIDGALIAIVSVLLGGCGAAYAGNGAVSGRPVVPAESPSATCPAGTLQNGGECSRFVQLALGTAHSCALAASGSVWCWGENHEGQLGDGTRRSSWHPVLLQGVADVVEIKASRDTTCARTRTGQIACWGSNQYGQGSPLPIRSIAAPQAPSPAWCAAGGPRNVEPDNVLEIATAVPGVVDAVALAVGVQHACSLRRSGTVSCWGDNSQGQLSEALPPRAFQRAEVSGLPKAIALSAAGSQTCVISEDKAVWCWGGCNEAGQLGTADKQPTPRRVPQIAGAAALAVDPFRVCAKLADGWVCWGDPNVCPTAATPGPPVFFKVGAEVAQPVTATEDCSSCALSPAASVGCSFMRADGQIHEQAVLSGVRVLAAGDEHYCAILASGQIACWGPRNSSGQLGRLPSDEPQYLPNFVNWERSK